MKDGPELTGALSYSRTSPSFVCSILMDGIVVGADAMSVLLIAALMKSIAGAGWTNCLGMAFRFIQKLPYTFFGGVTGVAYRDEVLQPIVAPFIQNDLRIRLFQQDNARAHTARISMIFLLNNNVNVLPWPELSPDMSPIEHVWDLLGQRLRRRRAQPQNLVQLERALLQEWQNIPQADIQAMINSMRRRCLACIRAEGGHTRY